MNRSLAGILFFTLIGTSAILIAYGIFNHYFILPIIIFLLGSIFAYLLCGYIESKEDMLIEFEHLKDIRTPLGEIALEKNMITVNQLAKILKEHSKTGEMFGKIAVKRGFLTENKIKTLLEIQHKRELINKKKYENTPPSIKESTKIFKVSSGDRENSKNKATPLPSFYPTTNKERH